MTNHTPEPWHVAPGPTIIGSGEDLLGMPNHVARLNLTVGHYESEEANALRIVACVNACEGVSNYALDGGWKAVEISAYAKRLETDLSAVTAQRDELIRNMRQIESIFALTHDVIKSHRDKLDEIKAIARANSHIAKCEEKPCSTSS